MFSHIVNIIYQDFFNRYLRDFRDHLVFHGEIFLKYRLPYFKSI